VVLQWHRSNGRRLPTCTRDVHLQTRRPGRVPRRIARPGGPANAPRRPPGCPYRTIQEEADYMRSITTALRRLLRAPTVFELESRKDVKGLWRRTPDLDGGIAAIRALGRMGNEAFPFLVSILQKPNKKMGAGLSSHRNAQRVLEIAGDEACDVFEKLKDADDKDVRDWANRKRLLLSNEKLIRSIERGDELTKEIGEPR